jgi:CRP-like cAMP-binding protein
VQNYIILETRARRRPRQRAKTGAEASAHRRSRGGRRAATIALGATVNAARLVYRERRVAACNGTTMPQDTSRPGSKAAATASGEAGDGEPSARLARVLARCRSLELARGAPLTTAGVCRVETGLVAVGFSDTGLRVLHLLGPGRWFRVATAPRRLVHRARGRARLAWVEAAELAAVLPADACAVELALVLAERERVAGLARALLIHDPVARLALRLADLFEDVGAPRLDLSQAEMAAMAALSRHSVNRALGRLERAGAVVNRYRRVELADRAKLLAMAPRDRGRETGLDEAL